MGTSANELGSGGLRWSAHPGRGPGSYDMASTAGSIFPIGISAALNTIIAMHILQPCLGCQDSELQHLKIRVLGLHVYFQCFMRKRFGL